MSNAHAFFKSYFLIVITLFHSQIFAQEGQRVELPIPGGSETYQTIPLGEKGVVLVSKPGKRTYNVQKYNSNLEKEWSVDGDIQENLDYVTATYDGTSVYLLFSRYRSSVYQVVKVNVGPGFVENFILNTIDRFQITDFKTLGYSAYMAGTLRDEPVLIHSNLQTGQSKVLPSTIKGANAIQSIEVDTVYQVVNVSFAVQNRRSMKMVARSYDEGGQLFSQVTVEPEPDYALLNGRLQILNDSVQMLVGTYGYANMQSANSSASQGLYISKIVDGDVQFVRYHSFTEFDNFFNFMNERQLEKMERRIHKKKQGGEDVKLNYRLLVHDIIPDKDHYLVVAEAFYPEYKYNTNPYGARSYWGNPWLFGSGFGYGLYNPYLWNPYLGGRGFGNNQQVFDGFVYTHAIVAGIDYSGRLIWDNSINFDKVKSMELREKVNVQLKPGGVSQIVYSNKGAIRSKLIKGKQVVSEDKSVALPTNLEGDKVRDTATDAVSHWYGGYYLAWGEQRISNAHAGDAGTRGRRTVFYLNKIAF